MNKIIVFCDFDGTLTTKDSFIVFIKYYKGKKFWKGILANFHYLLGYKMRLISNEKAKEKLFAYFFKGEQIDVFQKKCDYFSENIIPTLLREQALQTLQYHLQEHHEVVIVSASIENYLKKWCIQNNFQLIATQIEVAEQKLTGRFASKNCYGVEKVNRIKQLFNLANYSCIYAYGDTKGDLPMLQLAHTSHYKPFHKVK